MTFRIRVSFIDFSRLLSSDCACFQIVFRIAWNYRNKVDYYLFPNILRCVKVYIATSLKLSIHETSHVPLLVQYFLLRLSVLDNVGESVLGRR